MGSINLFRIDDTKQDVFSQEIDKKMDSKGMQTISRKIGAGKISFDLKLFLKTSGKKTTVNWNWLSHAFNGGDVYMMPPPKAVLVIAHDSLVYAVTFGYSYFTIDKFCDRDFSFSFARKIEYKKIKTTTLTTPNTQKNKTVNTFIDYNEIEFDSGESYAKLKVIADIPKEFPLFKPAIEIGNSIKFSVGNDSLDTILDIILFVENTINTKQDIYKIPVFKKVADKILLGDLENKLTTEVKKNPAQINISELDIIGATEIFNTNDSEFEIKYEQHQRQIPALEYGEIESFCVENNLATANVLLDISVVSKKDGVSIRTDKIKNLIDYTDDSTKCVLSKGIWFKYNDDYLQNLKESIQEIDVIYDPQYDFTKSQYDNFINLKYIEEKDNNKYMGKTEKEIKFLLERKYYAERSFNLLRELKDGFQNYDRKEQKAGTAFVEITDLYKNKTMFAVKIGNTSSKLCYVIDQSLTSLRMYRHKTLPNLPKINAVVIWLVLDRKKHLGLLPDGKVNLDELNMLMLKNRIDQWKKEVRKIGFTPCVYINYKRF